MQEFQLGRVDQTRLVFNCTSLAGKVFPWWQFFECTARVPTFIYFEKCLIRTRIARLFWRIGSGCDVKIWMYKWIPWPSTFCVVSPVKLLPSDTNVSILIDSDTKIWNDSLILTRILWITKVQKCNQDYDDFGKLFAVTRFRISLRSLWCLQQLHGQREYCGSWRWLSETKLCAPNQLVVDFQRNQHFWGIVVRRCW